MKFQPLESWIMGNESITPINFYGNLKPCMEMGAFIGLDVGCDLYLANMIDTGMRMMNVGRRRLNRKQIISR